MQYTNSKRNLRHPWRSCLRWPRSARNSGRRKPRSVTRPQQISGRWHRRDGGREGGRDRRREGGRDRREGGRTEGGTARPRKRSCARRCASCASAARPRKRNARARTTPTLRWASKAPPPSGQSTARRRGARRQHSQWCGETRQDTRGRKNRRGRTNRIAGAARAHRARRTGRARRAGQSRGPWPATRRRARAITANISRKSLL